MKQLALLTTCLLGLTAVACAPVTYPPTSTASYPTQDGVPDQPIDIAALVDPTPVAVEKSKYGNPNSYEALGVKYFTMPEVTDYQERGVASWYGKKFAGKRTSSGEPYDPNELTAAHARLPLPSYVEVTNLANGLKTIVKVNDRGPFSRHRLIDLSYAAAVKLGIDKSGTAPVSIKLIKPENETDTLADEQNKPTEPVAIIKSATPAGDTYLQLGAFSDKTNAERLRDTVQSKAFSNTLLIQSTVNGKTLHKLRIGPFADVAAAQTAAIQLAEDGIDAKVVMD